MADLKKWQRFAQLGVNTTPTDRTGAADWLTAGSHLDIAIGEDGTGLVSDSAIERLATEHRVKGNLYSIKGAKNGGAKTLTLPLQPAQAGTLLDMVIKETADGNPQYHQFREWWTGSIGGSGIGRQVSGLIAKSISLAFDRSAPAAVVANLSCILNRDSQISSTTQAVSGATNATPIVLTVPSGHGLVPGDVVVVASVGGNTAANGTWVLSAAGATTVTLQGSVGNGSYTSGGTIALAAPGTGSVGTPTFPTNAQGPYRTSHAYIDLEFADSAGAFSGWTGKHADLRSLNLQIDNGAEVDMFDANAVTDLDGAWTKLNTGEAVATFDAQLFFAQSSYADLARILGIRKVRVRIMVHGPSPSGQTTTVNSETAGNNVTVEVAATTGFAVNDYVLLNDGTRQCVGKVTTVNAGVSLVIDTLDTNISAGATVKNTAWEIKVPLADLAADPTIANQGAAKVVNISAQAVLLAGQTAIVTHKSYNDDAA